jgi:hypothetical protein
VFTENPIILQTVETLKKAHHHNKNGSENRRKITIKWPFVTSTEIQIPPLFTTNEFSYLIMTGHSQQFSCTGSSLKLLGSSFRS